MRRRVAVHVIIALVLSAAMTSCSDDSDPVRPQPPPPSPSGWFWQNPLPQGNWLNDVSFTDANTGTAVG